MPIAWTMRAKSQVRKTRLSTTGNGGLRIRNSVMNNRFMKNNQLKDSSNMESAKQYRNSMFNQFVQ